MENFSTIRKTQPIFTAFEWKSDQRPRHKKKKTLLEKIHFHVSYRVLCETTAQLRLSPNNDIFLFFPLKFPSSCHFFAQGEQFVCHGCGGLELSRPPLNWQRRYYSRKPSQPPMNLPTVSGGGEKNKKLEEAFFVPAVINLINILIMNKGWWSDGHASSRSGRYFGEVCDKSALC